MVYGCLLSNLTSDSISLVYCILDSSNDVFEFKAKDDLPSVDLRSGPKSYTFGGFTKALELFHEASATARQGKTHDGGGDMDGMEAFLNECDEGGEGICLYEGEDEMEEDEESEEESIKAELVALVAMKQALHRSKDKYALQGDELDRALATSEPTLRHYAAILVASELRTIFLYELAIELVRARLEKEEPSVDDITCSVNLTQEDEQRVKLQANELAQAFISIRYPIL